MYTNEASTVTSHIFIRKMTSIKLQTFFGGYNEMFEVLPSPSFLSRKTAKLRRQTFKHNLFPYLSRTKLRRVTFNAWMRNFSLKITKFVEVPPTPSFFPAFLFYSIKLFRFEIQILWIKNKTKFYLKKKNCFSPPRIINGTCCGEDLYSTRIWDSFPELFKLTTISIVILQRAYSNAGY